MDRTTTIILLAFASLVLGALATAIFIYVIVPWRRRRRKKRADAIAKAANPTPSPTDSPEEPEPSKPAKSSKTVKQHSLFIIFDQPNESSDERLTEWLREKGAHYDSLKKVFLINGQQPANPITIANAFLPGELPDLFREGASETIKGISLIVKPPLRKRRNQQVVIFVELAKEAATLFNANVLDTSHDVATEETYAQIIGE
ncbi:cell division protein ZipA C-terminal FtsZ-binding domain-containing protein [Vreelandella titanicae]|uniref:Uncharacterized protein n=1 Tax=Vreelandella titanicae TaxID=664683 RepID=A0A558JE29_9GAMM|nr:cell division protein ZipA C-terminal FtsZ-binding domain-containing protein [Halomonas titanicae]TVU91868.1 hypothetical protein FQP89_01660 [Halomonas titanicae]